jgi:hypothetical protein
MHQYFHSVVGQTDLAVMREEANQRTQPGNKHTQFGQEASIIHHHRAEEPCSPLVEHEFYAVPPTTSQEMRKLYWKTFAHNTGGHA